MLYCMLSKVEVDCKSSALLVIQEARSLSVQSAKIALTTIYYGLEEQTPALIHKQVTITK